MGTKTIQIADKTTLDNAYNLINKLGMHRSADAIADNAYINMVSLPNTVVRGATVVVGDEIHILGGSDYPTKHHVYNLATNTWTLLSTIPYQFSYGAAVYYKGKIHIFGGSGSSYNTKHYTYDGTSWTNVGTLPYNFTEGSAVVYNGSIYLLGSSAGYATNFYRYDGTSWSTIWVGELKISLPYSFINGSAVVYGNEIHILGGDGNTTKHYKWNGTSWTSVSTLPRAFYRGAVVILDDEIHILGGKSNAKLHCKFDLINNIWEDLGDSLPVSVLNSNVVVFSKTIYFLRSTLYKVVFNRKCKKYSLHKGNIIICNKGDVEVYASSASLSAIEEGYEVTADSSIYIDTRLSDKSKLIYSII